MAPSLTETKTVAEPPQPYKLHLGQYKEIDAVFVDKEAEEGKTGEPPANVCLRPLCSAKLACPLTTNTLCSTLTTSLPGTALSPGLLWSRTSTTSTERTPTPHTPTSSPRAPA